MIIHLVGPNAIGKTTAVQRWSKRYGERLTTISCDNNKVTCGSEEFREKGWQGTAAEKDALVKKYQALDKIIVMESARTTTLCSAIPQEPVILVTCAWQLHKANMMARCAAKNKRFRAEYWTDWKLNYECTARYVNFAKKRLPGSRVEHFHLTNYAEWDAVDAYFGALFRQLYNKLVRSR